LTDSDPVADIDWAEVHENLDRYPWVVWSLSLYDPHRLAGDDVAARTEIRAHSVVDLYGCVYEYCVDDDELS
jgi:hypothetical protein